MSANAAGNGTGNVSLTGGLMDFEDTNGLQQNVPLQSDVAPTVSTLKIHDNGNFTLNGSGELRDLRHIDPSDRADITFNQAGGRLVVGSDVLNEAAGLARHPTAFVCGC